MASEVIDIVLNLINNASKGIDEATKKVDSLADRAANLSAAFAPASLAAGAALGASVKFAAEYDKAIQGAVRGLDLNEKEVKEFDQTIKKLTKDLNYQFGAAELADIATQAGKLGVAKDDVDDFAASIAKIAVATDQTNNIEKLATNASKIANVFKLNVKETDEFLNAVNKLDDISSSTSNEILNFTRRVAGIGATAKLSAKELSAWGATLISSGQAPEVAATFMNSFLQALGAAENLSPQARESLKQLGYEAKDLAIAFDKNASATMQDFIKKVKELDTVSQRRILGNIFGQTHVDSALQLLQVTDSLEKNLKEAGDAAGNAAKAQNEFNKASQSFEGLAKRASNQAKQLGIGLGQILLPGVISVLNGLDPLIQKTVSLVQTQPEVSKWIVTLLGVTAAIAPVLALVSALAKIGAVAFTAIKVVGVLAGLLLSAPGLAVAGWAALAAAAIGAAYALYTNWGKIVPWFQKNVATPIVDWWKWAIDSIVAWWNSFTNWFGSNLNFFNSGKGMVKSFVDGIFSMASWAKGNIDRFMGWLGQFFPHSDAKKGFFSNLTDSGRSLATTFLDGFNSQKLGSQLGMLTDTPASPNMSKATLPVRGSGGNSLSLNLVYNITASNNNDLIKQLEQRDRALIDMIKRSTSKFNRVAY